MRMLLGNQALCEALTQEMAQDERVFLLGEDVARYGGVYFVSQGLLERFGPERVIDAPISEGGIVGLAVGASLMGMRPVVEIQFTDLITIAMDQIVNSGAKARYVHNGGLHAPFVVRTVNIRAGTVYSSQALEAWFAHVPGLKVAAPSDPHDAKGLLISAIRDPDPVIFFEHGNLYGMRGHVPEESYTVPFGQAAVRRQGKDVTLVAWSTMVALALEAATALEAEGIDGEMIDLRTLVPLDKETIIQSVSKTGRLVIAHEAVVRGGYGAEIAAMVAESPAFGYLQAPIVRVANPGVPVAHSPALHKLVLPGKPEIVAAVKRVMAY